MIFEFQALTEHWPGAEFEIAVRDALSAIPVDRLPLQQATSQGGIVDADSVQYSILETQQQDQCLLIRSSVFFVEMVGGCNCHDDPAGYNVYAELVIELNLPDGQARIRLSNSE